MKGESTNFMLLAFKEAQNAYNSNEVPIGAVVVKNGLVVGSGFNQVILHQSVSKHAEINAINAASKKLNNYRLTGCDIYVTLEPCHMCAKAIVDARLNKLYFATPEPKTGAVISIDTFLDSSHLNHRVSYSYGEMQQESAALLKKFFQLKRS